MADILKEIIKILPKDKISDAAFEGANIVVYTKDKDYFLDNYNTPLFLGVFFQDQDI
ncbi:MAG: hypothetical protein AABY26_06590 [Nanoarchaeota archaeon]